MIPIRFRILALALALVVLAASRTARADEPQIYLSWHAPWGQPGATDTLSAACDSSRSDTLWLSFDSGKPSPTFIGFNGTLIFHPPVGDTLSGWWLRDLGKPAPPQMTVAFPPRPDVPYPQPFRTIGAGGTMWDTSKSQHRLRFIYAIPYPATAALARGVYVAARVIIRRPPAGDPACGEPLCIEWAQAEISYDVGTERAFARSGAHALVSLNSPDGAVAVPYRTATRRSWQPKTP